MTEGKTIHVYGVFKTPEEIDQDRIDKENGVIRYHETTYLEYEIPKVLEDELSKFIEKRIAEFEKTCQCEDCKNNQQ